MRNQAETVTDAMRMTGTTDGEAITWPDVLTTIVRGNDLSAESTTWAMQEILAGNATAAQVAGFAVGLRAKGETIAEVKGLVEAMYQRANVLSVADRVVDIVGTGGDRAHTVNISTMSAIVMAGAGLPVVKHGNRASSSASGSADVLEASGVRLDVPVDAVLRVLHEAGITFCFAPLFHASFRFTAVLRRELGIATVFNFLGPLTNPARPSAMAVGSADPQMAPIIAGVFAARGTDALVFRGDDGLDEITTTTTSSMWSADSTTGAVERVSLDPRELGFELSGAEALQGGDATYNADVMRRVIEGESGPVRHAVLMNAAAGIAAHEAGRGTVHERIAAGVVRAQESIDAGHAARVLSGWVQATQQIMS